MFNAQVRAAAVVVCLLAAAGCREEGDIRVRSIDFEGVNRVDEGQLKRAIATRESSWLPWGRKHFFDRSRFDADLRRIQAFYTDRGFPDARVESVDVQMNDERNAVSITVRIDEGAPVLVEELDYEGFDVLPEGTRAAMLDSSPLREGQPLDRSAFQAAREAAANVLADHGYPYAAVYAAPELIEGDPKRLRIVYRAVPGPIAVFGPIEIAGNVSVDDDVIRRELTYRPGGLFRRSQVRESQRELYGLELFEFANIEALADGQPSEIPTRITVAEGKHRRVNFGAGYGTEEKLRGDAEWIHTNFFGDARTARVHGRWSSLDRGLRLNFTQPYLFEPHLSLTISGQGWNTAQPMYDADTVGGRLTLTHRKGTGVMWAVSLVTERQRSAVSDEALEDLTLRDELIALGLDPRDGTQSGTLVGVELDFQRNATDSLLNARRGYFAGIHLEQAGGWLPGSYDYYSVTADARYYLTIADRAVVASRVQVGGLDAIGGARERTDGTRLPFAERFFLGGSTSLRGWGRFEVSPLSGAGLPIGGRTMFEASTEVRVPVWGNLSAVGFVDAGNVWADAWELHLDDLRYAAGPGLRYLTPIGPVRADFGYQLTPIEGLLVDGEPERRRWRVHFSIGQAF